MLQARGVAFNDCAYTLGETVTAGRYLVGIYSLWNWLPFTVQHQSEGERATENTLELTRVFLEPVGLNNQKRLATEVNQWRIAYRLNGRIYFDQGLGHLEATYQMIPSMGSFEFLILQIQLLSLVEVNLFLSNLSSIASLEVDEKCQNILLQNCLKPPACSFLKASRSWLGMAKRLHFQMMDGDIDWNSMVCYRFVFHPVFPFIWSSAGSKAILTRYTTNSSLSFWSPFNIALILWETETFLH